MNVDKPKISVIIPIYKAEKYIERCAVSLFEQSLSSIEYIFVDDCSPDNSVEVLDSVIKRYPRRLRWVKVLKNNQNSGVGYSRARGVDVAMGEYIIHCDPDDWVERNAYEDLYEAAITEGADMVICGMVEEIEGKAVKRTSEVTDLRNDVLIHNLFTAKLHGSLCNKLINREFVANHNIRFVEGLNMCEDLTFCFQVLKSGAKVSFLNECFYHYDIRINPNSISSKKSKTHADQYFKLLDAYDKLFNNKQNVDYYNAFTTAAYWAFMHDIFSTNEYVKFHFSHINALIRSELGVKEKIATIMSAIGLKSIMYRMYIKFRKN